MAMKTYPTTVKDGKVYAEVTLRDVVEHNDVSDLPMLTEIKRLYKENDKLRELATETMRLMQTNGPDCGLCKHYDECWAGDAMNYSPSGCVICNEARELGIEVSE